MTEEFLLCSNCFKDEGLKLDAYKLGVEKPDNCPNCHSKDGRKLTVNLGLTLAHRFFVRGSLLKTDYGAAPLIQFNDKQTTSVKFTGDLQEDVKMLGDKLKVGFFHYGPRLWMIGLNIAPLEDLQAETKRQTVINKIITEFPVKIYSEKDTFYRVRVNPQEPSESKEYDSSPIQGNGRFDTSDLSILYASQDIEVCLHECRQAKI